MSPYLAGWRLGLLRTLRSPGDLSVRIGFFAVILLVMSALWGTAIDANGGQLEGYTRSSLLWYVFAAQTAVLGVRPRTVEEIGDEIGGGAIAIQMLRPVSVVGLRMAIDLGEACARMAVAFFSGAALTWLFAGPPPSFPALAMLKRRSWALAAALAAAAVWTRATGALLLTHYWAEGARVALTRVEHARVAGEDLLDLLRV